MPNNSCHQNLNVKKQTIVSEIKTALRPQVIAEAAIFVQIFTAKMVMKVGPTEVSN